MNTDFRLSIGLFTHPKFVKLRRKIGAEGALSYITLLSFVAQNNPDGDLGNMDSEDIAIAGQYDGNTDEFVAALVAVRFLDAPENDGDSYRVHDWAEHNPWAASAPARSSKAKAAAAARWGNASNTSQDNKQCSEHATSNAPSIIEQCPSPSPSPSPSPYPYPYPYPNTPLPPVEGEAFVADATDAFMESDLAAEEIEDETLPNPGNPKPTKRQDEEYNAKLIFAAYREIRHPTAPPMPPNGEWSKHRADARKLFADGATTEQVRAATAAMMSRYPEANMWTFPALVRKWTALLEPQITPRAGPAHSQNGFNPQHPQQHRQPAAVNGANTPWRRPT